MITLDADTQLPHGSAQRLVETIAHPLNRVELTGDERNRARGYTIIQPRVSITLHRRQPHVSRGCLRMPAGRTRIVRQSPIVYQDLFGEAIYHGKGHLRCSRLSQNSQRTLPRSSGCSVTISSKEPT